MLILTPDELHELTGYHRQAEQLAELHRRGYVRSWLNRFGKVVLTRAHFEGVNAGNTFPPLVDTSGVVPRQTFDAQSEKRRQATVQRTPPWANRDAIEAIYSEAQRLTEATGVPHHVDHEVPLRGRLVSGLHVESNLRVITGAENVLKHNRFEIE